MKSTVNKVVFLGMLLLFGIFLAPYSAAIGRPTNIGITRQASATGQLRACQAKQKSIETRMTHLTQLATTMENTFDKIAARVEDYYTTKVVPSGKTLPNYLALVTAIQTEKTAVQTALNTAQTTAGNFSCAGSDPKTQITLFRQNMQSVKSALKAYRTAVRNLIVTVRSMTGKERSASPTP